MRTERGEAVIFCENRAARFVRRALGIRAATAKVYRVAANEFNEPVSEEFITVITGQYYRRGGWRVAVDIAVKGTFRPRHQEGFLTTHDESSALICGGDLLELNGDRYTVLDIHIESGLYGDLNIAQRG